MRSIWGEFIGGRPAIGLLVLRVVFGAAMMIHDWPKIQNPFGWMNKMPDHPPGFLQALAALAEFGGGAALILGLLTPLAALGILCTMSVAILVGHKDQPWISTAPDKRPFELASLHLAASLALLISGPGRFSLDSLLFSRKRDL